MTDTPESPITLPSDIGIEVKQGSGVSVSADTPLLSLKALTKHFGPVEALRYCDLDIPAGKVTALIGDNGAGKSTLIKTISGRGRKFTSTRPEKPMPSESPPCIRTSRSATTLTLSKTCI
jgi:ABC-type glutathione transport system ATPase component